jgi:predicted proteasome-type protease
MKDLPPKDKAKELVNRFTELGLYIDTAKQCAIIAVDEVMKSHYKVFSGVNATIYNYYQEVKQEI